MSEQVTHQDLIKAALLGPMGDGVKTLFAQTIYGRVKDQADRLGVFAPAWPTFIQALRDLDFIEDIYPNPSAPNGYDDPLVDIKYPKDVGPIVNMKGLTSDEEEALEAMIDRTSLRTVARALSEICSGKAEHLATNWQDRSSAKYWDRAAGRLDTLAANVEV